MIDQLKKNYLVAILETRRDGAFDAIDAALDHGHSPETVIFKLLIPAMEEMAAIVESGEEATLAQLYLASQISSQVTERLIPIFSSKVESRGTMIIGTAFEDFHGLGKKIVSGCLASRLVKVIDLGLNVTAEKFVDTAVENEASVIGISSMMVHTARGTNGPSGVRELLIRRGLEDRISLVVGGAPYKFHPELYRKVGANAWARDGMTAAGVISDLMGGGRAS
ncbi:MAG TPA: cobalamin-binding protein [Desulfobacteraceae bacterium]|nr:cobalamin-binding protein [Desulfobacteraceae bacterium]